MTSRSWQLCVLLFTLEEWALGEMSSEGVDGSILTLRTSAMPTRVSRLFPADCTHATHFKGIRSRLLCRLM